MLQPGHVVSNGQYIAGAPNLVITFTMQGQNAEESANESTNLPIH